MRIYKASFDSVTCFELIFPESRLSFIMSPYASRGFSGEGQVLQQLIYDIDEETVETVRQMIKKNIEMSPEQLSLESSSAVNPALAALGSRGLIGFDQHEVVWFYREFPFRIKDLSKMHPRLEGARKLLANNDISIVGQKQTQISEAYVKGSGVEHRVRLVAGNYKCTCEWFSKNQGKQGVCKHILAIQMLNAKASEDHVE